MGFGEGGGEELRLQSQQGQELSAAVTAHPLILKMSSEDQTEDHTNKLMIFVRFRTKIYQNSTDEPPGQPPVTVKVFQK
jgi:hypothetical protein